MGLFQKSVQHQPDLSLRLAAVSVWWLKVFKADLRKYTAFCTTSSLYLIPPPALLSET